MRYPLASLFLVLSGFGNFALAQQAVKPAPVSSSLPTTPSLPTATSQASTQSNNPVPAPPPLPFTTQVKKAVAFIQTDCLHEPTPDELAKMTPEDQQTWSPANLALWTPEKLAQLPVAELAKWKRDPHSGTGFVVYYPDKRIGENKGFLYLVTNRHVVEPGIEEGKPCKVLSYSVALNRKGTPGTPSRVEVTTFGPLQFIVPDDSSVDLAAAGMSINQADWDFQSIPLDMFATSQMIDEHKIVEGEPVLFAGLFIQYSGSTKLEPVVRTGSLAMLPEDSITTTLRRPGHIYLAEVHSFGGNSGSPMFIDVNKFTNALGYDYKLLES
jgi:hypothetical protein